MQKKGDECECNAGRHQGVIPGLWGGNCKRCNGSGLVIHPGLAFLRPTRVWDHKIGLWMPLEVK